MSHVVTIDTQVRDPVAVIAACERLQLAPPLQRTLRLFNAEVTGLAVEWPAWRYPVVCDTAAGRLHYDNFNGRRGDPVELLKFQQRYAVEKTLLVVRRGGQTGIEQPITTLDTELFDLAALGALSIARASHVEPDANGRWSAQILDGPVLGPYPTRSAALAAEVAWLTEHRPQAPAR